MAQKCENFGFDVIVKVAVGDDGDVHLDDVHQVDAVITPVNDVVVSNDEVDDDNVAGSDMKVFL